MSDIEMYGGIGRGLTRRTGRALQQVKEQTAVQIAQVEARADIDASKIDAVTVVAQRAMQGVAFVSQIEQQLGQAVPIAVTRLQAVGDLATLAMGQVVTDSMTKLRRY